MTRRIHNEIDIDATAEQVWDVLTDGTTLAKHNPVFGQLGDTVHPGDTWTLEFAVAGRKKPVRSKVTLERADEPSWIAWTGGIKGLMFAHHGFRIEDRDDGGVKVTHYENFDGFLVRFLGGPIAGAEKSHAEMNAILKAACEARAKEQLAS